MACKCISCSQPLPKSSSRRRVGATVSSHLLPEIKNSVRAVFPDEVALEVFLPRDIDTTGSVFLCKGCFQRYEKLQKLNHTIINLRKEIQADIEKSGISLGRRPIAAAVISEPQKSLQMTSEPHCQEKRDALQIHLNAVLFHLVLQQHLIQLFL